jgi:hypothetical protein
MGSTSCLSKADFMSMGIDDEWEKLTWTPHAVNPRGIQVDMVLTTKGRNCPRLYRLSE